MKASLDYIKNLDLSYLEKRLVDKEGWSEEDSKEAVRRYKNFLILICKNPTASLPPTLDIDEVWHNHILHTREYMRDCDAIFGEYLHHQPFAETGETELKKMSDLYYKACALYMQEFKESYPKVLDVTALW